MRKAFGSLARKTQCDERALLLAFIAVGMSVLAAVLLEKLLA